MNLRRASAAGLWTAAASLLLRPLRRRHLTPHTALLGVR